MSYQQKFPTDIPVNISKAMALLQGGEICAFPTDTIYGIGARLDKPEAIDALYAIKKRSRANALIALCSNINMAQSLVEFSPLAKQLSGFWPGALTLILPVKSNVYVPRAVNVGKDTLGIRIPNHPDALALIKAVGQPLATSSANISQAAPAMNAAEINAQFLGKLPILASEQKPLGLESTILEIVDNQAKLLRAGAISLDMIERQLGIVVAR